MTRNRARKAATRIRAAEAGMSYTEAHFADPHRDLPATVRDKMALTGASAEVAARMAHDARQHAQRFAADDHSDAARQARMQALSLQAWEDRCAGRQLRFWEVYVDVFTAALDDAEADDRLALHQRALYHYSPGIPSYTWTLTESAPEPLAEEDVDVIEVPAANLTAQQRADLIADYPPAAWRLREHPRTPFGVRERTHLDDYVSALHLASTRWAVGLSADQEKEARESRGELPADTPLRFYRARRRTTVLAGPDEESARRRGEQLAATVVDHLGRPAGRLAHVEPDDGFACPVDGHWVHPADHAYWPALEALLTDHETYEATTDHHHAMAVTLNRASRQVLATWNKHSQHCATWEAKRHTQPDGTRTLSTPDELAGVEEETTAWAAGRTAAQLRSEAEHDDHTAMESSVEALHDDDEAKRVERLRHRATVLRRHADRLDGETS